ncbi:MAG TPA: DUF2442 domain-containing protein [Candidatus Polarisedimenticolaceae bacterium]|nr:DUF2442 domain-containing protein [Candidatus Polarisedimenticolaceae bacterium]
MTNISAQGFWLLLGTQEIFLPFKLFPWFKSATVAQILNVEWPSPHHLYWPDLDADLATESIDHPEEYPFVSAARPNRTLQRPVSRVTTRAKKATTRATRSRRRA